MHLNLSILPGERNEAADALSRLGGDFDYLRKEEVTEELYLTDKMKVRI